MELYVRTYYEDSMLNNDPKLNGYVIKNKIEWIKIVPSIEWERLSMYGGSMSTDIFRNENYNRNIIENGIQELSCMKKIESDEKITLNDLIILVFTQTNSL